MIATKTPNGDDAWELTSDDTRRMLAIENAHLMLRRMPMMLDLWTSDAEKSPKGEAMVKEAVELQDLVHRLHVAFAGSAPIMRVLRQSISEMSFEEKLAAAGLSEPPPAKPS